MCDKPMGFRRKRGNRYGVGGEFVEYSVIVQIVRLTQRKADSRKAASEVGSATPPLSPHLPASPPSYLERGGGASCVWLTASRVPAKNIVQFTPAVWLTNWRHVPNLPDAARSLASSTRFIVTCCCKGCLHGLFEGR